MFNNYHAGNTTNNLNINACSGGIYKTYPESWFNRFHLDSNLSKILFRKESCFYNERTNDYGISRWELEKDRNYDENTIKEVVVLQMIICGDLKVIAEIITKEDFENNLKGSELECSKEEE